MSDLTPEQRREILDALPTGKIAAIKLYREYTGADLLESKEFIEALTAELVEAGVHDHTKTGGSGGCASVLLVVLAVGTILAMFT